MPDARRGPVRRLIGAAAILLAAACCLGALIAQGGRNKPAFDVLTHFSPLLLAGALTAFVLWLLGGRRGGWAPGMAAIAVISCLILMGPELKAAREPPAGAAGGQTLKLVQFNVWGENSDPAATTAWILATDPDILALEDAYYRSQSVVDAMAQRYPHKVSVGSTHLLSKTPILDWRQVRTGSTLWARVQGPDGRPLSVMATHLGWPLQWRQYRWQSDRLIEAMGELYSDDLILAGDFNLTPWSFAMRRFDAELGLERRTRAIFSWPAVWAPLPPVLAIDQVFAGPAWRTVSVERGPKLGSDHYPIVAVLARD